MWLLLASLAARAHADEHAEKAAVEAAAQAWIKAFNMRDADALLALSSPDLVLLDAGVTLINGRDAAYVALRKSMDRSAGVTVSASREIVVEGDMAWRVAALSYKELDSGIINRGQALEIWKRVDGRWHLHRQMSSSLLSKRLLRRTPPGPVLDPPATRPAP